jgi:hypothetical protein
MSIETGHRTANRVDLDPVLRNTPDGGSFSSATSVAGRRKVVLGIESPHHPEGGHIVRNRTDLGPVALNTPDGVTLHLGIVSHRPYAGPDYKSPNPDPAAPNGNLPKRSAASTHPGIGYGPR